MIWYYTECNASGDVLESNPWPWRNAAHLFCLNEGRQSWDQVWSLTDAKLIRNENIKTKAFILINIYMPWRNLQTQDACQQYTCMVKFSSVVSSHTSAFATGLLEDAERQDYGISICYCHIFLSIKWLQV